ncbi:MAG: aminotransferase class V-fold PLP-dependent enzyme [Defluviitaleaceae bacterium]|nr:aminotransferase class V-fold PLP-dependent enzyme [Defluviitaleaceae bacterium]
MHQINFDYASRTPADENVLAEFLRVEKAFFGNAFAPHAPGRAAGAELLRASRGIASLMGVSADEIIFTSGASEANNLAIKGLARAYAHTGKHILSTCLEHPSVSGTLGFLRETGFETELLKILPNGKIDLSHLKAVIRSDTVLLCVSAVDSELGAIQPLEQIADIVSNFPNCHIHVDAAQAVGKIHIANVKKFSTMCFSPHKFYGLCGFGVLVKRAGIVLEPLFHGGATGATGATGAALYRPGTPSPSLAAACLFALERALDEIDIRAEKVYNFRKYVLENIKPMIESKRVVINSPPDGCPYILNLSVKGFKGRDFQAALDARGIAVSVKSACSTDNAPSRAVFAVSGDKKNALNSWRVSFSHLTTTRELDAFLTAFHGIGGKA